MIEVCLTNSNIYVTCKYLLAVLTNGEITSGASYYIILLLGSRVIHMLPVAQDTYCGEIYSSTCITRQINIIFTIKLYVDYR